MARQRFSLVPDEVKQEAEIRSKIESGEINPEVYASMPVDQQAIVNNILFKIASEKVEPNQGTSALEFVLFAFMRIMNKKVNGISLTAEDQEISDALDQILSLHQITDGQTPKSEWLFDYMGYAYVKAKEFLENRKEHIQRKEQVMGTV